MDPRSHSELFAYCEAALGTMPALMESLIDDAPLPEAFTSLAQRHAALKAEPEADTDVVPVLFARFFAEAAAIFGAQNLAQARAHHDAMPEVPRIPFAAALKSALWARHLLDCDEPNRAHLRYELGDALVQLAFQRPEMQSAHLPRTIEHLRRSADDFLEAGDAESAAGPAALYTALCNELSQHRTDPDLLVASLALGERVLRPLAGALARDLAPCSVASNLVNTCRSLAQKGAKAEGFLRRALAHADSVEAMCVQAPAASGEAAGHLAQMRLRACRSAAEVHYDLASSRLDSFDASAAAITALCRRSLEITSAQQDGEHIRRARALVHEMDSRLRLLRPGWAMDAGLLALADPPQSDAIDPDAWALAGIEAVRGLQEFDDAAARSQYVDDTLDGIFGRLAPVLSAVIDQVGPNHHVCRLLLVLGALSSGRFGAEFRSMWVAWLSVVNKDDARGRIGKTQNTSGDPHLVARVLREIAILDAFLAGIDEAQFDLVIAPRRRLLAFNARLLTTLFRNRTDIVKSDLTVTHAQDIAAVMLHGLPAAFGLPATASLVKGEWVPPTLPASGAFRTRAGSAVAAPPPDASEPEKTGLRAVELMPKLQIDDSSAPAAGPAEQAGSKPQALDRFLKEHPDVAIEDLVGTLTRFDGQDFVIGRVLGRGRSKVAFALVDPLTGVEAVDRVTGHTIIARIERVDKKASPDASLPDRPSTLEALMPYLRMFTGGVLEVALVHVTQRPADWQEVVDELEQKQLVVREKLPGLRAVFLHFLPCLEAVLAPLTLPDPTAVERRFLSLYLHLVDEVMRLIAEGHQWPARALVTADAANIRMALRLAMRDGDRGAVSRLRELLIPELLSPQAMRASDELRRSSIEWLTDQESGSVMDDARLLAEEERAWQRHRDGDTAEALNHLERLVDAVRSGQAFALADPRFSLGVVLYSLGRMLIAGGREPASLLPLRDAADAFETSDKAVARNNLLQVRMKTAHVYRDMGMLPEALKQAEHAMQLARATGSIDGQVNALTMLSALMHALGRLSDAKPLIDDAMDLVRDRSSVAYASLLCAQGELILEENPTQALEVLCEALVIHEKHEAGDDRIMSILNSKGLAELRCGLFDAAEKSFLHCLAIAVEESPQVMVAATHNLALLHRKRAEAIEDPAARESALRRALGFAKENRELASAARDRQALARACRELAILFARLGEHPEARASVLERLEIHEETPLPGVHEDYLFLADLARTVGDTSETWRWQDKVDALLAPDAIRRIQEAGGFPEALKTMLGSIADKIVDAADTKGRPDDATLAMLAQLASYSAPIGTFAMILGELALDGASRTTPSWMPEDLAALIGRVRSSVGQR